MFRSIAGRALGGKSAFDFPVHSRQRHLQHDQRPGLCGPAHTNHNTLLSRKIQSPQLRRLSLLEATSHDAATVTAVAGH